MAVTEAGKFEVYRKNLQGLCDEHDLVYALKKDSYPITLTIKNAGGIDAQMSMLESAEEEGYRSPNAKIVFFFKDGNLEYKTSDTFSIWDALFNKIKNLYKNMHGMWTQFFHRDLIERGMLSKTLMPAIAEEDDGDVSTTTFEEIEEEMEHLETLEEDETDEEEDDEYDYDDPEESGIEA